MRPSRSRIVCFELLSDQKAVRNIAGKEATPEVVDPDRREVFPHGPDDLRRRDRFGPRETLQQRCETKEMIAVAVGDIDRGEVLSAAATTQSDRVFDCSVVRRVSTRTASRSPWMSVDEFAAHIREH